MHVHASQPVNGTTSRVLRLSLIVTAVYIVLLVVAGFKAHSLALISEAGHNMSDFLALALSWGAVYFRHAAPNPTKTFGYNRAGVLAAFINGMSLVLICLHLVRSVPPFAEPGGGACRGDDLGGGGRGGDERCDRAAADARASRHQHAQCCCTRLAIRCPPRR